jgi:hypothetical protein
MKKLLTIFSAITFILGCNKDNLPAPVCSTQATVKNLTGLDGCGYVFQLNDGTIIEPYRIPLFCGTPPLPKEVTEDPLYQLNWVDGKKVIISFDVIDTLASICMAGKIAKITCLQDLEPDKACIQNVIDKLKSEPTRNPPAKVYEYNYYGNKVYFIPQYCCDFPSVLLDESCNVICYPDGGLSGGGDGYCASFRKERKNEKLVWEDNRVTVSN